MNELSPTYLELERVYASTIGRGARSVTVTGVVPGVGASLLARALAARASHGGLRAVYVDFNLARPVYQALQTAWRPDDASVQTALVPVQDDQPYAVVPPPVTERDGHLIFREGNVLRRLLDQDLASYDAIIIDTSAVGAVNGRNIPAEQVAAATDQTILVLLAGVTKTHTARHAVDRLTTAGAKLAGVVLNDRDNPSLADEMCREANRLRRFLPSLTRRICAWVRQKEILQQNN